MTFGGRCTIIRCNAVGRIAGTAVLCLLTATAYAQTGNDAPVLPGPPAPQAETQPPTPPAGDTQTAEGTETTDCGCPKADPAAAQAVSEASNVIAANLSEPDKICGLVTPLVSANPCAAPDVIAAAQEHPEIAEKLAQCLSKIQSGLKTTTPESAATVQKVVSCAPPAFQAAYSESLASDSSSTSPGGNTTGPGATPGAAPAPGPSGTSGPAGTPGAANLAGTGGGFGGVVGFGRFGSGLNAASGPGGGSVSPF